MTLMYYAKDDTEEKYGWDLDSPVAPKVPRCVSRKYKKEWRDIGNPARMSRVEDYFAFKSDPDFKGGEEAPEQEPDGSLPVGSQKKYKAVTFAEDEPTFKEVVGAAVKAGQETAEEVDELGNKQRELKDALCDLHDAVHGVVGDVKTLTGSHHALSRAHKALEVKVDDNSSRIDDLVKTFDSVLSKAATAHTKSFLSGKGRAGSSKW